MTELKLVPVELTAENGAKAALMGEFHEMAGSVRVGVSWTTIKAIWKKALEVVAAPQQAAEPVYFIRDKGASKWLEVAETAYRAALAMPSLCETRILYAGHPPAQPEQPAPIPTCERLPTEADADYSGAVFAFTAFTKEWVLQHWAHVADCPNAYLYWQKTGLTLPAAPGGE